jgi:hypothetical protein
MQEPMQERERWDQLEAAVRDAVESQHRAPPDGRRGQRTDLRAHRPMLLLVLLLWTMIAWIWSTRPAFLFGEQVMAHVSPETEQATVRFALFLERSRVDAYVRRTGQLPANLEATGPVEAGVSMVRTSDGYELFGERGSTQLRLSSAMNADSFLGNSLDVLRRTTQARR